MSLWQRRDLAQQKGTHIHTIGQDRVGDGYNYCEAALRSSIRTIMEIRESEKLDEFANNPAIQV